jgi:hypothetical protein
MIGQAPQGGAKANKSLGAPVTNKSHLPFKGRKVSRPGYATDSTFEG